MAKTTTWTAAVSDDFNVAGNWDNGVAVSGDTVDCSTNTMPASNQLAAGSLIFGLTQMTTIDPADFVTGSAIVGPVVINCGANTVTLADDFTAATLVMTAGTLDWASKTVTGGGLLYTAGTVNNTGAFTLNASGNLSWNRSASPVSELTINASVTATLTANVYLYKLTGGATASIAAGQALFFYFIGGVGWWNYTGSCGCAIRVYSTVSWGPGNPIKLTNADLDIHYNNATLALGGDIDIGTGILTIHGSAVGMLTVVDTDGWSLACGQIVLGDAGATNRNGSIDCKGGIVCIGAGGLASGNAANLANALDCGSAYIELSGACTFDCDNITETADAGACHIVSVGGDTVSNFTPGVAVHCHNCTDGGGNDGNVTFDEHAAPGTLAMMGVGV